MVATAVIVGFSIYGPIVLLAVLLSWAFVRFWTDSYDESRLLTAVSIFAISLSLACLMLVPLDVLSASFFDASSEARGTAIEALYFAMFLAMMLLIFIVVPFCFFFYEEGAEETTARRCLAGLKYSAAFVVVFVVLVVLSFVLRGSASTEQHTNLGEIGIVEGAVNFLVGCVGLIGLFVWLSYSAFGLSWLGISFLQRRRETYAGEAEDLEREITIAREQRRYLRNKKLSGRGGRHSYGGTGESEEVGLLQRKERVLRQRQEQLGRIGQCYKNCMVILRPVNIVLGVLLCLLGLVVVLSLLLTAIDKLHISALHYIIRVPLIFNPIDELLLVCMRLFPLDYVLYTILTLFLFAATVAGINRLGIRLLWILLFPLRRQRTAPQGVLLASLLVMLVTTTIVFTLDTIAPRYTMFGDQMYMGNSTLVACSVSAPVDSNCSVTQIEKLVTDVKLRFSFFSIVFYWVNWVFIACYVGGCVLAVCLRLRSSANSLVDED